MGNHTIDYTWFKATDNIELVYSQEEYVNM